jgi:hypothetical protein
MFFITNIIKMNCQENAKQILDSHGITKRNINSRITVTKHGQQLLLIKLLYI